MKQHLIVAMTMALALAAATALAEQDKRPRYALKELEPGSLFKRAVVAGSLIPLTKNYAELTAEEQSFVKSQYEEMGPGDEPPYPVGGLASIYKKVADAQQRLLVTGPMDLVVDVNEKGEPESVEVLRSPAPEMTKVVAAIVMFQKYKPAICSGVPCRMQFPFRTHFTRSL